MSHEAGPKSASGFIGLGFVCASTGIVASCFLLAALQAAYSPFAMQLPAAPFEQLETEAFRLAFAAFMTFALWHRLVGDAEGRGLSWLFGTGAIAKLGVLAFAAPTHEHHHTGLRGPRVDLDAPAPPAATTRCSVLAVRGPSLGPTFLLV